MTTHFAAESASVSLRTYQQHDGERANALAVTDDSRETDAPPRIEFAPDGWRGLLDRQMNARMVAVVAQAFADSLHASHPQTDPSNRERHAVAVAFDGRHRSREFAQLFARVLVGNDIEVVLADRITPTPVVSYTAKARQLSAGIAITASHNPPPVQRHQV